MWNLSDFRTALQGRRSRAHACYDTILENCRCRMRSAVRVGALQMLFDVPEFMMGFSTYDMREAIVYLMARLTEAGFNVHYVFPRAILVSWAAAAPPPVTIPALPAPSPAPTAPPAVAAAASAALPAAAGAPYLPRGLTAAARGGGGGRGRGRASSLRAAKPGAKLTLDMDI